MITLQKTFQTPDDYDLSRIGPPADLLFFDIETTGFSGDSAQVYLIGCIWKEADHWNLIQWFADSPLAESEVLEAFFSFLRRFRILVHFNGDGFDIPFLLKRCAKLQLPYDFSGIKSFDIYKKIRPFRKVLDLKSLKQKAIEQFLGICRTDRYNGGQLIEVYQDYLREHKDFLFDLLILHNEDDLKGMPFILPILNYPDFFENEFFFSGQELISEKDIFGTAYPMLKLFYDSHEVTVPVSFSTQKEGVSCSICGSRLTFTIELFEGTLKHFYENYQDYYYLILEDMAVHKSVGEFVDKSARKKATANTCYTRMTGQFLPEFGDAVWEPVLRKERKDKICYVPFDSVCFSDLICLDQYRKQLLSYLGFS